MSLVIKIRNITRDFPLGNEVVKVLKGIDLDIEQGEYVALMGPSGSGKSTLMSVLYGMYKPDEGNIIIDGEPQVFSSPADAIAAGIGMVHQHFMLVEPFTVTQNIILGNETTKLGMIDLKKAEKEIITSRGNIDTKIAGFEKLLPIKKNDLQFKTGDDLSEILKLHKIYFDLGKYTLRQESKIELDKVVAFLNKYKTINYIHFSTMNSLKWSLLCSKVSYMRLF